VKQSTTCLESFERCKKTVAALLVTCLLAGCTATFTYNHLDWLIPWYVDDYVDITRDQKKILKGQLEPLLRWHREEELARYIGILDRVEADLNRPLTPGTVQGWVDQVVEAGERVEDSMLTLALEFSSTLSDKQMQEFTAKLWEEQKEMEEEFLSRSDEEYAEENAKYLEEFLSGFTGRLSPAQKERLRRAADSMQRFDGVWLSEREAWLNTLEPLLQRPDGWQEAVLAAHANRASNRPPGYNEIFDHNFGLLTGAVADVLNDRSEKQRVRTHEEIHDLKAKIEKLISD
jgi:hypothetical protein